MAVVEYYVSSSAGGAGNGLSAGAPFTWQQMLDEIAAAGFGTGIRFNVKADGTYTRAVTDTLASGGGATLPVMIRGYNATIGDGYLGRTLSGSGPLVTTNMPLISYSGTNMLDCNGQWIFFESLQFTGASASATISQLDLAANNIVRSCKITNTSASSTGAVVGMAASPITLFDCDVIASSAATGIRAANTGARILFNNISGAAAGTPSILMATAVGPIIIGNIIKTPGHGIQLTATTPFPLILGNTIVGVAGNGVGMASSNASLVTSLCNLYTECNRGIDAVTAGPPIFSAYDRFDRNTSNDIRGGSDVTTLTSWGNNLTDATQANEYENYAGGDYRLKSTSPAKAAAFPPYRDMGALQHQDSGGGGGSTVVVVTEGN